MLKRADNEPGCKICQNEPNSWLYMLSLGVHFSGVFL
jgi:hypothetical protein